MAGLSFSKLSGSGNDFILVDNREGVVRAEDLPRVTRILCRRKHAVGADGLIAIEGSEKADFRWRFFNADGSSAEMCGNGGRCAARYAVERGIAGPRLSFETLAGTIRAEVSGTRVKLQLPEPTDLRLEIEVPLASGLRSASFLNTGVPHAVLCVEGDLESVPVRELGCEIRRHPLFAPEGTNVDFIRRSEDGEILLRTYERGVEDETLACGTGAVASALVAAHRWGAGSPVRVRTRGGEVLIIHFRREGEGFTDVFLEGETLWVYDGRCTEEVLEAVPPTGAEPGG